MDEDEIPMPAIQVISIEKIFQLYAALPRTQKYFTLLLAWDCEEPDQSTLSSYFKPLVESGLVYFCGWGQNCEKVHDAVDCTWIEMNWENLDYHLMTTWHDDEQLSDALWFFQMLALPAEVEVFSQFERYVVAVGNHVWAKQMHQYILQKME